MKITLKTQEEFRDAHVTIELVTAGPDKIPQRSDNLYTDEEVALLQAGESELVAKPLRRRISELESALAKSEKRAAELEVKAQDDQNKDRAERLKALSHLVGTTDQENIRLRDRVRDLSRSLKARDQLLTKATGEFQTVRSALVKAEERIAGYDADRHTEKIRADQNKEWAERAEARVNKITQEARDKDSQIATLKDERDQFARAIARTSGVVYNQDVSMALGTYSVNNHVRRLQEAVETVRGIVEGSSTVPSPE